MKIRNKHEIYIYTQESSKIDGESVIRWKYKDKVYLNDQQDINDLDKTTSGIVDFDTLKLRTRKEKGIEKTDGISYTKLDVDESGYVIDDITPQYTVESSNKVGRSILYTCKTNNTGI